MIQHICKRKKDAYKYFWELHGQGKYLWRTKKMKVEVLRIMHRDNKRKKNWQCVTRFLLVFSIGTLNTQKSLTATFTTQLLDQWPAGFSWLAELQFYSSIKDNQLYLKGDGWLWEENWSFLRAGFQNIPHEKMTVFFNWHRRALPSRKSISQNSRVSISHEPTGWLITDMFHFSYK